MHGTIEVASVVVPLLDASRDYAGASEIAGVTGVAAGRLGEFAQATDWMARARDLAVRSGDPNALLDVDIWEGMVASERGELLDGIEVTRRGLEEAIRVDNKECQVVGHLVIGEQEWRRGQFEQAVESFEQAKDVAQYCEIVNVELVAGAWLSAARSGAVRSEALAELDDSLARAQQLGDRFAQANVLALRAQARLRSLPANVDGALADLEGALALFEEMGARPAIARALRAHADALGLAGRPGDAIAQNLRADELLAELGIFEPAAAG
jgi:tetratricopeptide (TPR) repeat protein